jgi:hypothetical protein
MREHAGHYRAKQKECEDAAADPEHYLAKPFIEYRKNQHHSGEYPYHELSVQKAAIVVKGVE